MKKLVAFCAFIMFGAITFAQTPAKQTPAPAATVQATPVAVVVAPESDEATAKTETKKDCSDADKKQYDSKSPGKKSCCSQKTKTKKNDTK
jgi:hypothetical protein